MERGRERKRERAKHHVKTRMHYTLSSLTVMCTMKEKGGRKKRKERQGDRE